jgi:hypothetical protein
MLCKICGIHGGDYEECPSSGKRRRMVLVGTDVSEQRIASIGRVKTISGLKHVSNSFHAPHVVYPTNLLPIFIQ